MDIFGEMLDTNRSQAGDMRGIVIGVVKENWDKEHPGMVKVEYIQGEKGMALSGWARCLTPYAGKGFGMYALPEVGSTVAVGFLGENGSRPIVLGGIWQGQTQLPENTANEKNTVKQVITKQKNLIKISDEEGKEGIELSTPAGQKITLDDEKSTITITDKDSKNKIVVDSKNGNISLDADKKIELSVAGSGLITLEKDKVTVKAGNITVEGKQGLTLKGQTLGASGNSVEVKGSGKLSLQSSGITEVKGSMVKIN